MARFFWQGNFLGNVLLTTLGFSSHGAQNAFALKDAHAQGRCERKRMAGSEIRLWPSTPTHLIGPAFRRQILQNPKLESSRKNQLLARRLRRARAASVSLLAERCDYYRVAREMGVSELGLASNAAVALSSPKLCRLAAVKRLLMPPSWRRWSEGS